MDFHRFPLWRPLWSPLLGCAVLCMVGLSFNIMKQVLLDYIFSTSLFHNKLVHRNVM